ncbi:MAG: hypothetical protein COB24_11840 [Hyphomicrobiales bacterium]|nr:MAG: hypothetical protein COB24_11840 [Hyphomicrobiales bacterium]
MNTPNVSSLNKALVAWGVDMPDWVEVLANANDATSQNKVADRLGVSGTQISMIIKNTYAGDYSKAEGAVRSHLMSEIVQCPVVGLPIKLARCLDTQSRLNNKVMGGAERVVFKNACPECPNFKQK